MTTYRTDSGYLVRSMLRSPGLFPLGIVACMLLIAPVSIPAFAGERPHIVLVMADDQGWGETSYNGHPILKTPNLDAMAASGLRFDRFYAGAPVCSPTRASVLTGRSNNRTGVQSHGYALRLQEKTLAQALQRAGYRTGHFGKWHLNGLRGPGVPVLASDDHRPGAFGFDTWLSVTNFFDRNPILSREGQFEDFQGDSCEIVIDEALQFIEQQVASDQPSFSVVWFGTPHSPFVAADEDMLPFASLDNASRHHYGELVALDRSIGTLRSRLRALDIADNTLLWYCSDNGGLPRIEPETVGGLRGFKGSLYEGGLRVPSIIEWPSAITQPRVTNYPAVVMDIFATIADIVDLPAEAMLQPTDGISLTELFIAELQSRPKPIPFNYMGNTALVDNNYKLIHFEKNADRYELYDLSADPKEMHDLAAERSDVLERLQGELTAWQRSLQASVEGADYPEGKVRDGEPEPRDWTDVKEYEPYFEDWRNRPEYQSRLKNK